MNKIATLAFAALAVVTLFSACVKHTSSSTYDEGTMTATVNGSVLTSKNVHACSCGSPDSYEINVDGGSLDMKILIKDPNFAAGITTPLDTNFVKGMASYTTGGVTKYAKTGAVTITSLTAGVEVKGTFYFTLTNGTTLTAGTFTAAF